MAQRVSARSYSLRRRAASSVASFDAPSTAARAALSVSASYYSPLAPPPADQQHQAEEDAEEEEARAVEGGKVDGGESSSTDSGVRVGQAVHSVQSAVGPVSRSAPHARTWSNATSTRFVATVTEAICTLNDCAHCCKCHLRHNKSGYGRCMRTARQPWWDCECAGKCAAGRCAQVECAGSHIAVDLARSQPSSYHEDHLSSTVLVASPHPTPSPSPPAGVRRAAGGVHVDEEVCVSPQAGMPASPTAAYRQPSTTVADGGLVASSVVVVGGVDGVGMAEQVLETSGETGLGATVRAGRAVGSQLPSQVLSFLRALPHTPHPLPVISDGRCSVASVLLALRAIPNAHTTNEGRRVIDEQRRRLGQSMLDKWTERGWVQQVPVSLRGGARRVDALDGRARRSYWVHQQLLAEGPADAWLDHCVLYAASAEYDVGVLVLYTEGSGQWYCRHVGASKSSYIVLYHACGHYEAVEYDGLRQFPADHELVTGLLQYATTHVPQYPPEDDEDLAEMEAEAAESKAAGRSGAAVTVVSTAEASERASPLTTTPQTTRQRRSKRAPRSRGKARARRTLDLDQHEEVAQPPAQPVEASVPAEGIRQLPPLIAQVAEHGPLYDRVSFHNHAQWRAANEPVWNAYRLASMTGQRGQLTAILLDLLLLPQRVLPKMGRSGKAARRRAVAGTDHRLRSEAERLRARYNCPDPNMKNEQQATMSTHTMDNTMAQGGYQRPKRAASTAAREAIRQQAADTTDDAADAGPDVEEPAEGGARSEEEQDEPFPSLRRLTSSRAADPDSNAARRANYLVQCGLARKAAQVLHSTTQMADMRAVAVQESLLQLHPRPLAGTVLPGLPQSAPPSVLEDDAGVRRLLTQSDNGTAAGPSGWGGNMLAILVQSDICRLGVIALLADIINGQLPDDARQLLLASRLVALSKPNSEGHRPIAVGELFYRLAAIVAVRRVSSEAASLLAPHQYGIGVPGGAEKIVHSLQHELVDTDKRLALLQLDITNAFNSCDRARLLRELYALPGLQSMFRIADFAYSQPSALVLSGSDGLMIESAQGVRQGDPLSALLFCVYMRQLLQQASEQTGVRVYGFFDDISLLGTPQQLMAALERLQPVLATASLQLNTAKSHFTYFHDQLTPLSATVLHTLSAGNIQLHHSWVGVVGAVVGRDDAAIRAGMRSTLEAAGGYDAFFRRVQLDDMPIQTAMLLLRGCMVPAMHYHLRCVAPVCIEDEAQQFDDRMMEATMSKLGLDESERTERTIALLQRKLRDGGWGMIAASHTSPAAYLGSLAACHSEPVFAPYCGTTPLPGSSLLHRWLEDGLKRVRQAAPGDSYQADIEPLLPATAGSFFHFQAEATPSTTAKLQHALNAKANQHNVKAAVQSLEERSRGGDKWDWAHHKAITARGAWGWKVVRPEGPQLRLADVEYAVAARLNFGLPPFPARTMATLPEECPLCTHKTTGERISLRSDPWHWLSCSSLKRNELTRRHDAVADAIARVALQVGGQVRREVRTGSGQQAAAGPADRFPRSVAADRRGGVAHADSELHSTSPISNSHRAGPQRSQVRRSGCATWCGAAERVCGLVRRAGEWCIRARASHRRGRRAVELRHVEQWQYRATNTGRSCSGRATRQCAGRAVGLHSSGVQEVATPATSEYGGRGQSRE